MLHSAFSAFVLAATLFVASACQPPPATQESAEPAENEPAPFTGEGSPSRSADLSVAPLQELAQSEESETILARNEAMLARLQAEERAREEKENREKLQEELDQTRAELEDLRRERDGGSEPAGEADRDDTQKKNFWEASAELEREWRPIFSEYQKRYSDRKREYDDTLKKLAQYQAWCNYNNMGEPNIREKEMGVRQEGLPTSAITEIKSLGYGDSCETIDFDIKKVKQDQFETLRDVQKECYDEAIYRGVSTAKARLR